MRKIVTREALGKYVAEIKAEGIKVVFTNGVFDILHSGHVRYLDEAASLGDVLIVAVNSDSSARQLKGAGRPYNNETDRAEVIAALECVSYVTVFDDDTPYELIKILGPDVLVKGGDWPVNEIVGADVVKAGGGEVYSLPYAEGHSTTGLIEKIVASAGEGTGE
ncbi:MAG: D-glycero-beta-D-manno-heptose 1-phosphate adenylyltransferase [Candidatus Coatesbacteria bacterium]|nr:MAG: D-glycero-beta-D-manno-heptose 1-phosphate adenylyltransferase [Candidatus Coatesbacteria bacterium]